MNDQPVNASTRANEPSGIQDYSPDRRLDHLLKTVVNEVRLYAEEQISRIRQLTRIGLALSSEKNIERLLEMIVDEARNITQADAGTLYIADPDAKILRFEIMQNDTMKTRMGGTSGNPITLPPISLEVNGEANFSNVSSYVAQTGQIVNIPDVYEADLFDFTGPKKYDAATGYRSKSMLVIPMENHEKDIIGVLQLLNAVVPETGEIIPFSNEYVDLVASLASQAAVALTTAQLIEDLKNLFNSFIKSIATAIDQKSPYTGGHIRRVVEITLMIAETIGAATEGPFADRSFSADEMEELRLAAWMHDIGKITTPEHVVDKSTKLETIFDRIGLVETRFKLIRQTIEKKALEERVALLESGKAGTEAATHLQEQMDEELRSVDDDLAFLKTCNHAGEFLGKEKLERLNGIAAKTFTLDGETHPYITENELHNLSVAKGSLTENERKIIENHALMTKKILSELPFPKRYANVPDMAASHHEKLDGSGYPFGKKEHEISLQARIMAVADIFEALTAKDRPYKEPMKLSQAVKILGFMKKDRHIDSDVHDLFIQSGIYREYAVKELNPDQIDDV